MAVDAVAALRLLSGGRRRLLRDQEGKLADSYPILVRQSHGGGRQRLRDGGERAEGDRRGLRPSRAKGVFAGQSGARSTHRQERRRGHVARDRKPGSYTI